MIVSRRAEGAQVAPVTPIYAPSWEELRRRVALAQSVLNHRESTPENWALLSRILSGATIDDLIDRTGGVA